ncbi:hypothetical protein BN946_scf184820.g3 [Trametes cinnabarina]|uniref:Uncharacterized protein n=1 Tax=Pycnoporus cinnabarinus TaxID=5643 RepID=A0A060SU44_PYCCI|nr:hypothetical protein BN946_scf184820.g3 [Trametes cinnabarina]
MESFGSFIPNSAPDFYEGCLSPQHFPSMEDYYSFSFAYYLDREGTITDSRTPDNEASMSQRDNYVSSSNAFGFVLASLPCPTVPSLPSASHARSSTPPEYKNLPSKAPATPPITSHTAGFSSPSPSPTPTPSVAISSSFAIGSASNPSTVSASSSVAASTSSSSSSSSSAATASTAVASVAAASSSTQHVFVVGPSAGADAERSPVGMEYSQDVPVVSDSFVKDNAVPHTLQPQTLRRSTRQAASSRAAAPSAKQRPVPSTKKAKTSESKKSFAKPTQPVARGSAMPQAGPSGTKEVPQRAPKRAIEDVDTAEDEPAPKKKKPRALRRTRSEVDVFKIPTDPCDCPVQGCGLEFGNSRYDNVAHLKQHYGQNGLRYAKVDCLWPGCNVQVPGNTLIDHVQERHVGSVYRCPLHETPGFMCEWTTPSAGHHGQHMQRYHNMQWPPAKKEPGTEP